jgi:hypothetical protein
MDEEVPPILEPGEEIVSERGLFLTMRKKVALSGLAFFSCLILLAAFSTMAHSKLGHALDERNVTEYVTIFRDDMDSPDFLDSEWFVWVDGAGVVNLTDGCVFLNLGKNHSSNSVSGIVDLLGDWRTKWSHVSVECRLRCGDDNGLRGGAGAGHRGWGLVDSNVYPDWGDNFMGFNSHSPESDKSLTGFYVLICINGSIVRQENISHIDMRQWHNYTILWEPGNATFLVDGESVLTTTEVPNVPMAVCLVTQSRSDVLLPSRRLEWKEPLILEQDQWIQIDYVQIFMGKQNHTRYLKEANQTLVTASRNLLSAELMDIDTQPLGENHAQATEALNHAGYIPAELYVKMVSLADILPLYLDELSDKFKKAEKRIQNLILEGKDTRPLEAQLDLARRAVGECDFKLSLFYLKKITGDES